MIKFFTEEEQPELFQIVDEIHENLMQDCLRYNELNQTIHITTWAEMRPHMPNLAPFLEVGFGYSISNHSRNENLIRIIIINIENCKMVNLEPVEYKAIILHELGHLLNWHEPVPVPNHLYCITNNIIYSQVAHSETQNLNLKNNEIYADYYAKQFGYAYALISSFNKHNEHFVESIGFYDIRIERILNNQAYIGNVKPIYPSH